MHEKLTEWRKKLQDLQLKGEILEGLAKRLEIDHLPLGCRVDWIPISLDWVEFDNGLADFAARVKTVAARLGPAEKVYATHWLGAYDNRPPDLVAKWVVDNCEIFVRALSPKDCKIDPRTEYAPEKKPELHPECKAVLSELEDYDGRTS